MYQIPRLKSSFVPESSSLCADLPVGDDQWGRGDSSRNHQQGAHHLWEHAGPL